MQVMKITVDSKRRDAACHWLRKHFGGKSYESWFQKMPHIGRYGELVDDFYIAAENKRYLSFFRMKFSDHSVEIVDLTPQLRTLCNIVYIDDVLHIAGGPPPSNAEVKYFCHMQPLSLDHLTNLSEKIKAIADLWTAFPAKENDVNLIAECFREIVSKNALKNVDVDRMLLRIKRKLHQYIHYNNPEKLLWQIGWQLTDNLIFDWAHSLEIMMHVVALVRPFKMLGGINFQVKEYQRKTWRLTSPKMPAHLKSISGAAA